MPRYNLEPIMSARELAPFQIDVPFNSTVRRTSIYVDNSGLMPVYFIDAPEYFHRARLYGEADDSQRFAFFIRAVVEFARTACGRERDEQYDIIHLKDGMTVLVPAYMKSIYPDDPVFGSTSTVFTIHNLAFHGGFSHGLLLSMGLPEWLYR